MAAYGLYTHIASNRFRSMLLLAGLFVLVYVMVYAGALIAEVLGNGGGSVDYYLMAASRDPGLASQAIVGSLSQTWRVADAKSSVGTIESIPTYGPNHHSR